MQEGLFNLQFVPIELSHKNKIEPILKELAPLLTGYTFASFMSWRLIFNYEWAMINNKTLLFSARIQEKNIRHILQPVGDFTKDSQDLLIEGMSKLDYQIIIYGVSNIFINRYPEFLSHFEIQNDPGLANYIYKSEDLALLPGRKYAKKRNLICQAENSYSWVSEPITNNCVPECIKLLKKIAYDDQVEKDQSLLNERHALDYTLEHFSELNQKGRVIKVDNKPVAFSIYEELNPTTAVVHFEKADRSFKGLYQLINRETSKEIYESGYELINREEDINLPGLRKAKQSYYPVELRPAFKCFFKK